MSEKSPRRDEISAHTITFLKISLKMLQIASQRIFMDTQDFSPKR